MCVCCVWVCVCFFPLEWIHCTTWRQVGLHDWFHWFCRYNPFLSRPPPPHDSLPTSSVTQLLCFHPTSSPYISFLIHLFSLLSLAAWLHVLKCRRSPSQWNFTMKWWALFSRFNCELNYKNDNAHVCTQLLHEWKNMKADDSSVKRCLHSIKPVWNSIMRSHIVWAFIKIHWWVFVMWGCNSGMIM